jgi:hypothetical protein
MTVCETFAANLAAFTKLFPAKKCHTDDGISIEEPFLKA